MSSHRGTGASPVLHFVGWAYSPTVRLQYGTLRWASTPTLHAPHVAETQPRAAVPHINRRRGCDTFPLLTLRGWPGVGRGGVPIGCGTCRPPPRPRPRGPG